jgi:DNA repair protein RadC
MATFQLLYEHPPRTDTLLLRERPVRRVSEAPDACNLIELLAALIDGPRQIEIAEALVARFGSLRLIRQASARDIAGIRGIGQQTAARLVSALELGCRLVGEVEDMLLRIHMLAVAANMIRPDMSMLEQEGVPTLNSKIGNRLPMTNLFFH